MYVCVCVHVCVCACVCVCVCVCVCAHARARTREGNKEEKKDVHLKQICCTFIHNSCTSIYLAGVQLQFPFKDLKLTLWEWPSFSGCPCGSGQHSVGVFVGVTSLQ